MAKRAEMHDYKQFKTVKVYLSSAMDVEKLNSDKVIPFLIPVDSGVIHFVHKGNQMFNSRSLRQHGMFSGLSTSVESRFEFTFTCGYDL